MKFTKLLTYVVPATAAMFCVVGCSDFDNGFDAKNVQYQQQFEMQFGDIDPNQDWDLYGQLVKQRGMGMTTRAASDITVTDLGESYYRKITADDNKAYQKMLPESETSTRPYSETNLGRVTQNFSAYTTQLTLYPIHWNTSGADVIGIYYYSNSSDTEATEITGTDGKTYYIVQKQIYANKTHVRAVNDQSAWYEKSAYQLPTYIATYWDQLVENYPAKYMVSDGTQKDVNEYPIAAETKICLSEDGTYYYKILDNPIAVVWPDLVSLNSELFKIEDSKYFYYDTIVYYSSVQTTQDLSSVFGWGTVDYLESQPIQVSIPATVGKIGFYITNGGSGTKYSEAKLNEKVTFSDAGVSDACYVATYIDTDAEGNQVVDEDGKPVRYLCFEDWMGGATNFDLNDVVFRVYGLDDGGSSIVDDDETTEDALVVCEDLGDYDFDFNDVVFQVQYYSKESKTYTYDTQGNVTSVTSNGRNTGLRFIPLAAGGTLSSTIVFDYGETVDGSETIDISNGSSNEIHELLGGSAPSIINAGGTFEGPGATIEVPSDKLPTTDKGDYATLLSRFFAEGRFKIRVNNGEYASRMTSSNNYKTNGVPQMMLLPTYFKWAQEMTPINQVYTEFENWVSDATATDWISTYVAGKVTERYVEKGEQSTPSVDPEPSVDPDPEPEPEPTPSLPTGAVDLSSYVGSGTVAVPASAFDGMTEATVTLEVTYGFQFYGFTNESDGATWGDNAPGNQYLNTGTNSFDLTAEQVANIKSTGSWKMTFNGSHAAVSKFYIVKKN